MCNVIIRFAIGLAVSIAFLTGNFSTAIAYQAYTHTSLTDKVDNLFSEWDTMDSPGAALGIFKDGRIIYARGYGMANLEFDIPITPQTVFRIGSVSKQFTAMCIAILADRGTISLDDDIRKYLPEMYDYDSRVTIRHMLHHTSGMRPYTTLMGLVGYGGVSAYTAVEAYEMLARQKGLLFEPGERYAYSNSAYFLLAEIVGRVSGMKTSEFAKQNIFEPLGMNNTHYHDDVNMITKSRASGYSPLQQGGFRINMTQIDMIGDGSIYTTIEDFLKWNQNYIDNKLGAGGQKILDMVFTEGVLNDGSKNGYGFGLRLTENRGLRTIGHGGSWAGFRANFIQYPEQKLSIVILANSSSFNPGRISNSIANLYLADLFTEPAAQPGERRPRAGNRTSSETITLRSSQLNELIGIYYSDELDVFATVTMAGDKLVMKLGKTENNLLPSSPENFAWGGRNRVAFDIGNRNEKNFTMLVSGMNLKFEKIN
ncbi:beta-lactamase family protein [candidate division KSB1 bacterium]|nr:beta-lactamase family protein [candidate division KSB1 bacterium]